MCRILLIFCLFCLPIAHAEETIEPTDITLADAVIDLRKQSWGQGKAHILDGLWDSYWDVFIPADQIDITPIKAKKFPVPAMWGERSTKGYERSSQGHMTYHLKVLLPLEKQNIHMYIPDMPSAYKLWVNNKLKAQNGIPATTESEESPNFRPHVIHILEHQGVLDIVVHLSNFHYREGGIWYSLKVTDDSGLFQLHEKSVIFAVFFGAILIAIGLMNLALFVSRTKELTALYFGLLCITVGIRRLLIDERVLYLFDLSSWEVLQRLEHLCFYLALPLFLGFFAALFRQNVPAWTSRISWLSTTPFLFVCMFFPNKIYTELNISFQILVMVSVFWVLVLYLKMIKTRTARFTSFGISLLILGFTVCHDVLKSNGIIGTTENIAHFGVLAFIVSQTIALQRNYLKSLTLIEDMSAELQDRNMELIEIDKFKDEFLSTTSHELRTPLQGISGLAKILIDDGQAKFTEDQHSKLDLIATTTKRLSVLVNDILDFSSIKHGKLKLHRSMVDLNATSELVLSTMTPVLGNKNVTLTAQIAPEVRYLEADEFRLQQVLFNIMGNAAKYTETGFIQLVAYLIDESVVIEINDSGAGIPDEKLQSLFRPFEQVHVEGHHSASGTGLGLSISRQLVELHGGTLELQSRVGNGTTVYMTFPDSILASQPPQLPEQTSSGDIEIKPSGAERLKEVTPILNKEQSTNSGPLVFVVDDEPINLELIASQLNKQGLRVELFSDGIQILSRLTEELPDLILLDYIMPRMTGIEVCQLIRKQYDAYELPVMMLTARHQINDIVHALSVGANDYLIKPYHEQEMAARVQTQLSVRQYWIANKENQKLKSEIERRIALEDDLSELNSRLLTVLDFSAELIILINNDLNIVYANAKATSTFQKGHHGLLGQAIFNYIHHDISHVVQRIVDQNTEQTITLEKQIIFPGIQGEHEQQKNISIKSYYEGSHNYLALVMTNLAITDPNKRSSDTTLENLTAELSESRKKINEIEGALRQVMTAPAPSEKEITERGSDQELLVTPTGLAQSSAILAHKEEIVSLLRTSLNLWESYTNNGKVDLAERSRCWRVYIDGTTVKTRTFDKYLSARSVPDRPRWRAVVRTANYVGANCELSESERKELTQLTQSVESYYS